MDVLSSDGGVVAVNLVIWTGLFVYLLRLGRRVRAMENREMEKEP